MFSLPVFQNSWNGTAVNVSLKASVHSSQRTPLTRFTLLFPARNYELMRKDGWSIVESHLFRTINSKTKLRDSIDGRKQSTSPKFSIRDKGPSTNDVTLGGGS
ncbi:hypothetical protein AVEN_69313-1 [Araneus ventricosus]|uniref:Uncharacterized protein n=1 Tax=Araneus ventricosus TaxID=182803 RepID=A0A4Y2WVM9_ARAVE|nr:hypothetical protein AVEN_69313-1 [Araneus ventricosus]